MGVTAGTRFGPYEITGRLGEGGMGEVYRARDTRLAHDVASKVLPAAFAGDADRVMRFEREALVLASLNHPHIAQIHGLELQRQQCARERAEAGVSCARPVRADRQPPSLAAAPDGQHFVLRQAEGLPGPAVKVIVNWPALPRTPS